MSRFFLASALCFFVFLFSPVFARAQTADALAARQAELQAQLDQVLREIDAQQQILSAEQKKGQTIQGDINILNAKISEAKLKIKARQIAIEGLGKDINKKTETIKNLSVKIEDTHQSLSQLMRKTNQIEDFTLADMLLSDQNLSEFFADVDAYNSIKDSIQVSLGYIKKTKQDTETAKQTLNFRRLEEIDARISIEAEKASIEKNEKEKSRLLSLSKAQQKTYQSDIKSKQAKAAQIRSALFALRDTEGIPFGDALKYATLASQKTGVQPALILAILTQESDLGKNQGSCLVSSLETGDGSGKNTGTFFEKVMKAPRDTVPFGSIAGRLGRDWKMTPVSCPLGVNWSSSRGYGGGMGPSQFIPSTWELFKNRLGSMLGFGGDSVDPWNPEHAILATAVYMADLGADSSSYTAQRNAACRYYSGRACDSRKPYNSSYGTSVMTKAASIQKNMIDPLSGL